MTAPANDHGRCAHALGLCAHPEDLRHQPGDNVVIRPLGVEQRVTAARVSLGESRLLEAVRVAELSGDHVWTVLVAYLVTNPADYLGTDEGHLDAENLVSANVGCFRCEEPLSRQLVTRRCPGEPRHG